MLSTTYIKKKTHVTLSATYVALKSTMYSYKIAHYPVYSVMSHFTQSIHLSLARQRLFGLSNPFSHLEIYEIAKTTLE